MVRVFVPAVESVPQLAGVIEHVGTGWSARFSSSDELLASFRSWLEREGSDLSRDDRSRTTTATGVTCTASESR